MGRAPCCDKSKVKRGPWSPEEDETLKNYLYNNGTAGNWIALPNKADLIKCHTGLKRCGKSCRLRWLNYLRPDIKHGSFTPEEDTIIFNLYSNIGSRWSVIASKLPGRTDNDVKNHWNTKLKKKLMATQQSFNFTINPPFQTSISTPSQANLIPKIEAYNPDFPTSQNYNSQQIKIMQPLIGINYGGHEILNNNSTQEGSSISDSSSLAAMDSKYGTSMDFWTGISNDFMSNCIWYNQDYQTLFEEIVNPVHDPTNSYVNPVMCQNVSNIFY